MPITSIHGDVTTYFAPRDTPAEVILAAVQNAKHSIRIADYGYTLKLLTQALVDAKARGVDVYCIFDHTQAHGKAEVAQLDALTAAGVDWIEGTSEAHRAIMHQKSMMVDAETVIYGSYNFSEGAAFEANTCSVTTGKRYAAGFLANWYEMFAYIWQEEGEMTPHPIIQPTPEATVEASAA